MSREKAGLVIDTTATVIKHTTGLPYNHQEFGPRGMEPLENEFLKKLGGRWPTYEEVYAFSQENNGIRCRMFGFAAVDLFRERGVAASLIIVTDRTGYSKKSHALVNYSQDQWLEPQTGRRGVFNTEDGWEQFCSFYGKLIKAKPINLKAVCEISADPRPGFGLKKEISGNGLSL